MGKMCIHLAVSQRQREKAKAGPFHNHVYYHSVIINEIHVASRTGGTNFFFSSSFCVQRLFLEAHRIHSSGNRIRVAYETHII